MENSVPLNSAQADMIYRMYNTEPVIKCCASKLMQALFSGGITVNVGNGGPRQTEAFGTHLDTLWVPFACDLLTNFMLWGFCPYIICKKRDPETRRIVQYPVALEYGTYEIRFEVDNNYEKKHSVYQRNYANKPLNMRKPDSRVRVAYYENSTRPSMHGTITTPLASVVNTVMQMEEMNEYAVHAASIRSNPTLFVESTPDSRKFEEVTHLRAFDGDEVVEAHTERQIGQTQRRYESMLASKELGSQLHKDHYTYSKTTGKRMRNHRAVWENSVFCIPDGTTLSSNTPQADGRTDIVQLNMHKDDVICAVLGVPKSLMFSNVSAMRAGASDEIRDYTFRRTLDSYKKHITSTLNDVYRAIYKTSEDRVTVPGTPLNSIDDILICYDRGVIDGNTMARYVMRAMNASDLDINTKRMKLFDQRHVDNMLKNQCLSDPAQGVPPPKPDETKKQADDDTI